MADIKKETISGAKWGILQKCTMQPIQLIYGMVLARLITPEEMGIVGLTAIFFAIASQLAQAGFGAALVRKIDRTEVDCSTMFWFNIAATFVVSSILFLLAPWFTRFYNQPELLWLTRVSAFNMFIGSTASVHWALYQCRRDFKTPAIVGSICALAGMPVCLILAWMGWGVWALMWQGLFSGLLGLVIVWIISPWKPRFLFSKASFLEMFSFGSKMAVSGILHILYTHARTFIIGKFYSPAQLGLYNKGASMAHLAPDTICGILGGVIYPVLCTVQDDNARLTSAYRKYMRITTLGVAWCTMVLIAMANPLVELMYGRTWLPCVPFLQIVAAGWAANHMNTINLNLLMVKGRSDLFLRLEIIKKTISIAMLLYAATISVEAICWAGALYCHLAMAFNAYFTGKILGLTWWAQQKDYLPYFLLAGIASLPGFLCTFAPLPIVAQLAIGGLAAALLYLVPLHLARESAYAELYNTFKATRWGNKLLPFKAI